MTWIDWVMVAFVFFAALQGLRRGVLAAAIGIVAVLAAYLAASVWYRPLADVVTRTLRLSPSWAATVAFLVLLIVAVEAIGLLVALTMGRENVPAPSRLLGMAVGAVRGIVLATALLVVVLASPPGAPVRRDVDRSAIAPVAVTAYRGSLRALAGLLPAAVQPFGTDDARF